jgi:hypothetical protein
MWLAIPGFRSSELNPNQNSGDSCDLKTFSPPMYALTALQLVFNSGGR